MLRWPSETFDKKQEFVDWQQVLELPAAFQWYGSDTNRRLALTEQNTPISALVAEGWEIVAASSPLDSLSMPLHSVLMCKDGQHKFVTVSKKLLGNGLKVDVTDV
jgi:hypothetical protein